MGDLGGLGRGDGGRLDRGRVCAPARALLGGELHRERLLGSALRVRVRGLERGRKLLRLEDGYAPIRGAARE